MSNLDREFGWDDLIDDEGSEYTLIPEGDYDFRVESVSRGRHNGSEKMPACNKAILKILINYNGKEIAIEHNLFLHSRSEKNLGNFFLAIGLKKKGEPLHMNWNAVPGAKGRCHVNNREYNGNKYNNIKYFITSEEKPKAAYQAGAF